MTHHADTPSLDRRITDLQAGLSAQGYVADRALASVLVLMDALHRPLLLEGEAGVGKTEIAATLARLHGCALIRLQCYEGLDTQAAVYEWNYPHQLLAIKLHAEAGDGVASTESDIFSERFLIRRPLLQAISEPVAPVLLIDEIDRADEAFEAFLLEVLADYQITVPEIGTLQATTTPRVILTSNGTRELSDALRRRCLYHWLDFPDPAKEVAIVERRLPGVRPRLARQAVAFVQRLRVLELRKTPGVAETLDWVTALAGLGIEELGPDPERVAGTLACLVKTRGDRERLDAATVTDLLRTSGSA